MLDRNNLYEVKTLLEDYYSKLYSTLNVALDGIRLSQSKKDNFDSHSEEYYIKACNLKAKTVSKMERTKKMIDVIDKEIKGE